MNSAPVPAFLTRLVDVRRHELAAMLWSFAYFFCLLCGYYILRPVRDEMGVALGKDGLERLFLAVFIAMLIAVPVFGMIVRTFRRRSIVPLVYGFFIANLVLFWMALESSEQAYVSPALRQLLDASGLNELASVNASYQRIIDFDPPLAAVFFVWASVFNLFAISLFWSLMSEVYSSDQAKRLYGIIAAGGTAGATNTE